MTEWIVGKFRFVALLLAILGVLMLDSGLGIFGLLVILLAIFLY